MTCFGIKVRHNAECIGIPHPKLPRKRKVPKKIEVRNGEGDMVNNVKTHYCRIYYEGIDLLTSGIRSRFDQPGYRIYSKLEAVLVKTANNEDCAAVVFVITDF